MEENFKYCYKCGQKLPIDANFCDKCGTSQSIDLTNIEVKEGLTEGENVIIPEVSSGISFF